MELQFDVPIAVKGRPEKCKTDHLVVATVPVSIDVEECSRGELKPAVSGSWDNREITFTSNSFENHGVLKP